MDQHAKLGASDLPLVSNVIGVYADPAAETDDWGDDFILEQRHSPSGDSSVYTSEALSPTVFDNDAQASLDEDDSEQVSTEKLISDTSSKRNSLDKQKEAVRNSICKNAETSPPVTTCRSAKIASSPRRTERVAKRLQLNDNDGSSNATNRDDDSSLTDSDEDVDRTSAGIKGLGCRYNMAKRGHYVWLYHTNITLEAMPTFHNIIRKN